MPGGFGFVGSSGHLELFERLDQRLWVVQKAVNGEGPSVTGFEPAPRLIRML